MAVIQMDEHRTPGFGSAFERLVEVMMRLREPGGCPWDREQDLESLKTYVVEEAYEVVQAIEEGDWKSLREELGDLLLQVVFQARIAEEGGHFTAADVADGAATKIIGRHPHVFGDLKVRDAADVLSRWEGFKRREGKGLLDGVPASLPALLMALRVSEKVSHVGFDWPDLRGVMDKLDEETAELKDAVAAGDRRSVEEEVGDLLFVVANIARKSGLNPEEALRKMLERFRSRFAYMEKALAAEGKSMAGTPLATLDELWERAKRETAEGREK